VSVTQRICHSRLRRSEGRQGCQPGGATLVASSSIVHTRRQPMHPDSLVDTPGFWPLPHARCPTVRPGRPTPAAYAHHSSAKLHARNGSQLEKVDQLGQGSSRRCPSQSPHPRLRADTTTRRAGSEATRPGSGLSVGYMPLAAAPRSTKRSRFTLPPSDDRCLRRALTGKEAHGGRWRRAATLLTQWKVAHIPILTTTP